MSTKDDMLAAAQRGRPMTVLWAALRIYFPERQGSDDAWQQCRAWCETNGLRCVRFRDLDTQGRDTEWVTVHKA